MILIIVGLQKVGINQLLQGRFGIIKTRQAKIILLVGVDGEIQVLDTHMIIPNCKHVEVLKYLEDIIYLADILID